MDFKRNKKNREFLSIEKKKKEKFVTYIRANPQRERPTKFHKFPIESRAYLVTYLRRRRRRRRRWHQIILIPEYYAREKKKKKMYTFSNQNRIRTHETVQTVIFVYLYFIIIPLRAVLYDHRRAALQRWPKMSDGIIIINTHIST